MSHKTSLFLIASLLFVGSGLAYAQQNTGPAVTTLSNDLPEQVRVDAIKRLKDGLSFQVSKAEDLDKSVMRICNHGPSKRDDIWNQAEACERYGQLDPKRYRSASLDDLMPEFKACALDTGEDLGCVYLISDLYNFGYTEYAVAISLYAPGCHEECRNLSYGGDTISQVKIPVGNRRIVVTDPALIRKLVEVSCRKDGSANGCLLYSQLGGTYSEAERQAAQAKMKADDDQTWQARQDRENRVINSGPGFLSSLSDALTQVQQNTGASIENANAQQQANLRALAEAKQREQQAAQQAAQQRQQQEIETQQRAQLEAQQTAQQQQRQQQQASQAQSNTSQSCTDMTGLVRGTAKVGNDGWVSGYLTNYSSQTVHVFYTFKVNGLPSSSMANAGATTINSGQTVGGEGQGLYSTTADKSAGQIYWYAVLKSDYDQNKPCAMSHSW